MGVPRVNSGGDPMERAADTSDRTVHYIITYVRAHDYPAKKAPSPSISRKGSKVGKNFLLSASGCSPTLRPSAPKGRSSVCVFLKSVSQENTKNA